MNLTHRSTRHAGFTLLELLVVMVIIGLLAGFVAPRYFAQVGKSQVKAARAQIDALDKALEQYRIDVGHLPTTEQGLAALNTQPAGEQNWAGPYLKKEVPLDPGDTPTFTRAGHAQQRLRPRVAGQGRPRRRNGRSGGPRELVNHALSRQGDVRGQGVASYVLDAVDETDARRQLTGAGLACIPLRASASLHFAGRSARLQLVTFSQELVALLEAGLSLVDSIETLGEKEASPAVRRTLDQVLVRLREGQTLGARYPNIRRAFRPCTSLRCAQRSAPVRCARR